MTERDQNGGPAVSLALHGPDVAIATLHGEHDLNSRAELAQVLARASDRRYVLVDLSECTFIDSTILGLLVVTSQRKWERDGRLELVIPDEDSSVQRVIKLAGLTTLLTIHRSREEGMAGMPSGD